MGQNNQPGYKWYVVWMKELPKDSRILSAWEYKEDAEDDLADVQLTADRKSSGELFEVVAKRTCVQHGLDPDVDSNWMDAHKMWQMTTMGKPGRWQRGARNPGDWYVVVEYNGGAVPVRSKEQFLVRTFAPVERLIGKGALKTIPIRTFMGTDGLDNVFKPINTTVLVVEFSGRMQAEQARNKLASMRGFHVDVVDHLQILAAGPSRETRGY